MLRTRVLLSSTSPKYSLISVSFISFDVIWICLIWFLLPIKGKWYSWMPGRVSCSNCKRSAFPPPCVMSQGSIEIFQQNKKPFCYLFDQYTYLGIHMRTSMYSRDTNKIKICFSFSFACNKIHHVVLSIFLAKKIQLV